MAFAKITRCFKKGALELRVFLRPTRPYDGERKDEGRQTRRSSSRFTLHRTEAPCTGTTGPPPPPPSRSNFPTIQEVERNGTGYFRGRSKIRSDGRLPGPLPSCFLFYRGPPIMWSLKTVLQTSVTRLVPLFHPSSPFPSAAARSEAIRGK